jgi:hypothetical protein
MNTDLQKIVGGYIEIVHPMYLNYPFVLVCNEEGKIIGLPKNRACSLLYGFMEHGVPMNGNIVLMKEGIVNGEPDILGLSNEEVMQVSEMMLRQFGFLKRTQHE